MAFRTAFRPTMLPDGRPFVGLPVRDPQKPAEAGSDCAPVGRITAAFLFFMTTAIFRCQKQLQSGGESFMIKGRQTEQDRKGFGYGRV